MSKNQKISIALIVIIIGATIAYFTVLRPKNRTKQVKQINVEQQQADETPRNEGPVSPISGLSCENWNKRPVAVMQPSDLQARPAAGFSEADLVVEMPAFTGSVTRLMGVYVCNIPKEIGAIRSSRHDYIPLAKGLDAIFIHWGGSHFALDLLKEKVIDSIDCMTSNACDRWEVSGKMRLEDTGHIKKEKLLDAISALKFRSEGKFSGYPHTTEAPADQRPNGGNLRVAFKKPYDVEYNYDKATNSYVRTWGDEVDSDRNNGQKIAPKNIVVMIAPSEQITTDQNYVGQGLQDPWKNVEEIKKTGSESISGRYNNVQIGDPWYDASGSGDAYYYMNGKEIRGQWKKDRSKLDSKLYFYDDTGKEIQFVPGQIWLEILEPGQALRWTPSAS